MSEVLSKHEESTLEVRPIELARKPLPLQALLVLYGSRGHSVLRLRRGEEAVIGRSSPAQLVADDRSLSRQHAHVAFGPSGIRIRDLGSRNGCWLQGVRIREATLGDGDVAVLGELKLSIRIHDTESELSDRREIRRALSVESSGVMMGSVSARSETSAGDIVVESSAMLRVHGNARKMARTLLPVLVTGETGVGKEVVAHTIHEASPRAAGPFKVVNSAALPAGLLESVLFGHEKGAFTGATRAAAGLFEQADGGSLFLDEVGELSERAQAALLRVLETGSVTRLGSERERPTSVRLIAATNRNLAQMCQEGQFREDLLHRIEGMRLHVPPLRERVEEIVPLAHQFLRGKRLPDDCPKDLSASAIECLKRYAWPGNVRQLRNVVEQAAVLAEGDLIGLEDLPDTLRARPDPPASSGPGAPESLAGPPLKERLQQLESNLMREALIKTGGHRAQAAKLIGMPLRTFMKRLKEYQLDEDS
ncbi:MAG: sigma 54-interacting transcriptional regulator [Proteobacteria bacterium]|nr:sigma 54-interacting transcriptional regulator [Pseudomonadota bacterium]